MKNFILVLWVFSMLTLIGCTKDCGECFSPPAPFLFEILDEDTGDNVFTNGSYSEEDIVLVDKENGNNLSFRFNEERDTNIIELNSVGWETETVTVVLSLKNEVILEMYIEALRLREDCCSFTEYPEVRLENCTCIMVGKTELYRIFI